MPLNIAHLRAQHDQILTIAARMERLVAQHNLLADAEQIRHGIAVLASHLRLHLHAEDLHLYPAMMRSQDPLARTRATQLQQEMGSLQTVFTAYQGQWTAEAIRRLGPDFASATRVVISALRARIQEENETLFPLAKKNSTIASGSARARAQGGASVIVIIDDNDADVLLVSEAWKEHPPAVEIRYFPQARQALERIGSAPAADLVIIDLHLPDMRGLELHAQLRRHPGYEQIPIALWSSPEGLLEFERAQPHPATTFFPKPTTFEEYLHFVQSMRDLISFHRST